MRIGSWDLEFGALALGYGPHPARVFDKGNLQSLCHDAILVIHLLLSAGQYPNCNGVRLKTGNDMDSYSGFYISYFRIGGLTHFREVGALCTIRSGPRKDKRLCDFAEAHQAQGCKRLTLKRPSKPGTLIILQAPPLTQTYSKP